jgi:AcrR family transcriptional regulator
MARAGLSTDRVVAAAAELADEIGFDQVSVSAVARALGVKDASLYSHISSLRELRERVAVRGAEDLAHRLGTALMGRSGREALVAYAAAYREFALGHPGLYRAIEIRLDQRRWAELGGRQRGVDHTYALLRGYGLAEPELTDAARLLLSALHGLVNLERHGGYEHPRPVADSWPGVLDALHLTLERWPRPAGG